MKSPHACENHANSLECWRNLNPARSAPEQRPEGPWSPGAPSPIRLFPWLVVVGVARLPFPDRTMLGDVLSASPRLWPPPWHTWEHGFLNPVLWSMEETKPHDIWPKDKYLTATSSLLTRPSDADPFVLIVPKRGFLSLFFFFLLGLCGDEAVDAWLFAQYDSNPNSMTAKLTWQCPYFVVQRTRFLLSEIFLPCSIPLPSRFTFALVSPQRWLHGNLVCLDL